MVSLSLSFAWSQACYNGIREYFPGSAAEVSYAGSCQRLFPYNANALRKPQSVGPTFRFELQLGPVSHPYVNASMPQCLLTSKPVIRNTSTLTNVCATRQLV